MDSSSADPDRVMDQICSNPSSRKVRIIGKIRGFTNQESESVSQDSKPWVTINKSQEGSSSENGVRVSFTDPSSSKKDASYELDYCYGQEEDAKMMFSNEIKPLISGIFVGKSVSIIAYGARGSGKTCTIQGTEKNPGLAVMALTELLPKAEQIEKSVSLSLCEVYQEHVYDILDPNHSEIQVLEDARGKINLKGLSQVSVKSISEFQNAYFSGYNFGKSAQKIPLEQPKRSHKVMIINVSDNSNCKLVGKMNFVDLAGYVDARRTSTDGSTLTDTTRINKSLHAVLNVVYALNANESRVPYRESKLTHMLKESLGGRNHILLMTCLNPLFCQDTLHTLSLASRSFQSISHASTDSIMKVKSSARFQVLSSQKRVKPATTPATVKKQVACSLQLLSAKKCSAMSKGRKLFYTGKKVVRNQEKCTKDADSVKMLELPHESDSGIALTESRPKEVVEEMHVPDSALQLVPRNEVVYDDKSVVNYSLVEKLEEDISVSNRSNNAEVTHFAIGDTSFLEHDDECLQKVEGTSPPLSERLREISNKLRLFQSTTPLRVKMPDEVDKRNNAGISFLDTTEDTIEPKTPRAENSTGFNGKLDITKYSSPWERFNQCSSGMKNTLVEDYLKFLNTASKEELKRLKGIGEKRATYILELREESPEPFKSLDDIEDIGLSAKQVKGMMKDVASGLFG